MKNQGLGVFLVLVGGPLGLFYASITGGVVMLSIPICFYILILLYLKNNLLQSNLYAISEMAYYGLGFPILFIIYYAICIIWSISSINEHNSQISKIHFPTNSVPQLPHHDSAPDSPIQKWLKDNPGRSLNDYFIYLRSKDLR